MTRVELPIQPSARFFVSRFDLLMNLSKKMPFRAYELRNQAQFDAAFVGRSISRNVSKSYLAELLWGLSTIPASRSPGTHRWTQSRIGRHHQLATSLGHDAKAQHSGRE